MQTKPNIVYYNDDHSRSPTCTDSISDIIKCTYTLPSTWQELTQEIETGAEYLAFHIDMISKSGLTVAEFVSAVDTIRHFSRCGKCKACGPVKIMVLITPNTPLHCVRGLQELPVSGIGLDINYYPIEEVAKCTQEFLANRAYWPEHIISQLPIKVQKPLVLHFREDFDQYENNLAVHKSIESGADCRRMRVKTWNKFVDAIRIQQPTFVTIHYRVIDLESHTLAEFINSIRVMMRYLPHNKQLNVPIAIGIDRTCSQSFVSQLRALNIAGIHPVGTDYGIDEAVTAIQTLLTGQPYWPEHIISQLPRLCDRPQRPLHIYFRDDSAIFFDTLGCHLFESKLGMQLAYCNNWEDLGQALAKGPIQLIFHIGMLKRLDVTIPEIMSMLETRLKIAGLSIPIAVAIEPDTTLGVVKELKKAGVVGIKPALSYWGIDEAMLALQALRSRRSYWPKHIIDQLPGNKLKQVANHGVITHRQAEVLNLIKTRGLSNKQIARVLNIAEPTVKMHVSDIMKVYGVRSRVQLAVLA